VSVWIKAARVPTLPAAVVPVLVGTALAIGGHHFRPGVFAATLVASLLIQIGTNYANDYFDFRKGADTPDRLGPLRITSAGLVAPERVVTGAITCFALAGGIGVYLITVGGWPILVIGVASILAGVAYTGGPFPFGYYGLGDVICFFFFGMVAVMGTYYLEAGGVTSFCWLAAIPVACLVTAILVVNNLRDIDTDRAAGKMTLAARMGRPGTRIEFMALLLVAYASPFALAIAGATTWWLFWLPLTTVPLALPLMRAVGTRVDGPSLNLALKGAGRLHLVFGFLLAFSLLK